jgi:hypothetical protein
MPTTPLLLWDNFFDTVNLYPNAVLTASAEITGREALRVADYRRDRSWWQAPTDGAGADHTLTVDHGAGRAYGADYLWLDRGHNLWGRTVTLEGGDTGASWPVSQAFTVPAAGTLGGTPSWPTLSVTEEGACYSLAAAPLAARRFWRLRIANAAGFIPVVTGLMVGLRTQLLGYSRVFDEDQRERTQRTETSVAGYRATDRTYSWRLADLDLTYIGSAEYDGTLRRVSQALFDLNQPWFLVMDYATHPERGWLFQYDGTTWGAPKQRAYRQTRIRGREVGASIG